MLGHENENEPVAELRTSPGINQRKQISMANAHGPVALLSINRDSLSQSHRHVNKKVRNTRDVLKVGDFVNEKKFENYESPA